MLLVDWQIKEAVCENEIHLEPFVDNLLQPNSYDVRLGDHFIRYRKYHASRYMSPDAIFLKPMGDIEPIVPEHVIDPYDMDSIVWGTEEIHTSDTIIVEPGDFILARTQETVGLPENIAAKIDGKSSIARLGIVVHQTGGFIDAGFYGTITLEISNANPFPVKLYVGMSIAQIEFHKTAVAQQPYNRKCDAKYGGQVDATLSKFYLNAKI
jgi:dCTP deaminase